MSDVQVTAEGMPALHVGGVRYPLFFSLLGNKRWAEHRGVAFEEIMQGGWSPLDLSLEDLARLLTIALEGGEIRRHLVEGGEKRVIDGELVQCIFARYHAGEITPLILAAWNQPPRAPVDPQAPPAAPPAGGSSSE
ncbi:MAG: hypothetical protein M1325_01215 [Actinobacteria bacterium]|nr:hypothetical protein [Actinomycetota bacterium]